MASLKDALAHFKESLSVEAEKIFNRPQLAQLFLDHDVRAGSFFLLFDRMGVLLVSIDLLSLRAFLELGAENKKQKAKHKSEFSVSKPYLCWSSHFDKVSQRFSIVFIIPSLALLPHPLPSGLDMCVP